MLAAVHKRHPRFENQSKRMDRNSIKLAASVHRLCIYDRAPVDKQSARAQGNTLGSRSKHERLRALVTHTSYKAYTKQTAVAGAVGAETSGARV